MIYVTDRETGKIAAYHSDAQKDEVLATPGYSGCAVVQSPVKLWIGATFPTGVTVLRAAISPAIAAVIEDAAPTPTA